MATELRFPVEIDAGDATKELNALNAKMDKLKKSMASGEAKRAPIVEQLKQAQDEAVQALNEVDKLKSALAESEAKTSITANVDPQTWIEETQRQAEIKAQLAEQEKILAEKDKAAQRLEAQDAKIVDKLKQQTAELETQETRAGELTRQITEASKGADIKAAMAAAQESIKGGIKNLLKYGIGIRSLFVLFRQLKQYTIEAVKAYAENDPETQKSINELKASLQGLKGSWGAAFAPILTAVIPVLQTLIGWLTSAANAVAMFLAIISGKSTFKKAISNTGELSDNLASGAGAAKELKKQLMGIDTLTIAQDSSSGGGGGGSSGGAYDWVEEPINANSFTGRLALSFKDVFVDWSDLTGEQIAEKIIAGLAGLAGGAVGFMIGGVPGAIIGTLAGLAIGLIADSIIFDHDGKLSTSEILNSLSLLLGAVGGGLIGFSIGGPLGAALGAAVGIGLSLLVRDVGIETAGNWSSSTLLEKFAVVLGGLAGGLIGFSIGGPAGAALGAVFGILLAMNINKLDLDNKWIPKVKRWLWDDGILQIIESVKILMVDPVRDLIEGIVSRFEAMKNLNWSDIGVSIVNGITDGLNRAWQWLTGAIHQMCSNLLQSAKNALGIHSPSKVFREQIGENIGAGIEEGLDDSEGSLGNRIKAISQSMVDAVDNTPMSIGAKLANVALPPMPAVAMGGVVPPNAFSSGYGYGISPELESKLDALLERLTGSREPVNIHTTVELDRRKVGEAFYTYTEERNRGRGK